MAFPSFFLTAVLALTAASAAQALQITNASPQGEVAQVRQVVLRFDADAVRSGDAAAKPPATVSCSDNAAGRGTGRWNSAREWVWQFQDDLPPGVRCTIAAAPGFQSPQNQALTGHTSFAFNTGGPFVRNTRPYGGAIDEEQYFVLRLNGPATLASVQANVWCQVEGLGERVPVKLVEGAERAALLKARRLDEEAAKAPLAVQTLACNRRLPPSAEVQLVFGTGVATPSGIANNVEKRFNFKVREPFTASFSCERENANAACLPIRPLRLQFNAPVPRALAEAIRLKTGSQSVAPTFEAQDKDAQVTGVQFAPPFAESANHSIVLPANFKDDAGRALANADSYPLQVATGAMPPLAKFAAAPFGIVERFAEPDSPPMLPVTLRNVEAQLPLAAKAIAADARVANLRPESDAEILAWFRKLQRYDNATVLRKRAAAELTTPLPRIVDSDQREWVQTRMLSLLAGQAGVRAMDLPKPATSDPRLFEVVGIPLTPGFHVLEISSKRLGAALLDERYGPQRTMVVRSSALVTNLGVHFKLGRENALAWVTTLDKGQPVAGARVAVSDCRGKPVASGTTDAQGVVQLAGLSPQPPACNDRDDDYTAPSWFVTARARDAKGVDDMAFTFSDWNRGIEPWRFDVPTSQDPNPDLRAHTIFDRTLLRAGETVAMKHLLRTETAKGLALPEQFPTRLQITHVGSGQQFTQPLAWRKTATGGQSAESQFALPPAAKLGAYEVALLQGGERDARSLPSGQFRVEEFRLPVLEGRIAPADARPLVKPESVPTNVQVNYVSGGGAANLPVRVSALLRDRALHFDGFDAFSFTPPRDRAANPSNEDEEEPEATSGPRVIADKLALNLDASGAGKLTIDKIPAAPRAQELLLEATYADPNGEVQTLRSTATVWPAGVVAGIKTEGWVSSAQKIRFQALALDLAGKPQAGVALEVTAIARIVTTSRKRMVGGFYTYDNKSEGKDLGSVCSGKSDARGLLLCEAKLAEAGEVELVVTAKDAAGLAVQAASSVYVTRQGELWFGGENHDRIDLLPEKKDYAPGETARLQLRMPFRYATALVTVEREGVLSHRVVQLNGQDPTLELKIEEGWGPNVYVSALVLRGRLREVPWYSLFTWGYKAPREWWTAFWHEGREYVAPSALVDLSKPAFRLGVAELRVGTRAHQIDVKVAADQPTYQVRGQARVTIQATLPDGKPAANAEVALAAVDQALLELMPNDSWNLLAAMLQRRAWGVETSTAQMEIIGRRHYGRKAVPAGGGGGRGATRELLDTLLLWNPRVVLDANGQAVVTVPLNDALTTFKIVAVADAGTALFGTGQASIRTTQDLQIISGLPPLVREDDKFRAQLTLRNTTTKAMKVDVAPRATLLTLPAQTVDIPAGEAREVVWDVTAPAQLAQTRAEAILWEIEAKDQASGARDALKASQRILPAVPLTVQQATLVQLDGPFSLPVQPPADALANEGRARGGLQLALQPRLAEGLPGVRDWFANYPYSCLEQQTSKAIGLRDAKRWQGVVAQMPTYLDGDGLAHYFPPRDGSANRGSDTLTAYLLAATHEASTLQPAFALPEALRTQMENGLVAFVEGRLQREFWSPRADLDVRKLAALEALSRSGRAQGRMLASITVAPNQWPTHAVIDWLSVLKRVADAPQREQRLAEAQQVLRARIATSGTKMVFSTERDDQWWWLMVNGDVNAARLLLAVMDDAAWKDDMGRLAAGFIARQQRGAWQTTTANLWGGLALEKFSAKFETTPVAGVTTARLGDAAASVDWAKVERVQSTDASGAPHQAGGFGAPAAPGALRGNTAFLPWPTGGMGTVEVAQQGTGKPWLTLQSLAAVPLKAPFDAGYRIAKTITPVEQAVAGRYSRGDVLRVTLEVTAASDMTWVVLSDPIPGGATILGSGLGRDSAIATQGERQGAAGWPAFEERSFEAYRGYYDFLPRGTMKAVYTLRLNNVGDFALPPTRVEALYAPEMFGALPNARVKVEAR
ncbi:alpha-2-macroglobulin [Pseudorhodoferax sp. Leaf267]|uniref:alpha-2-macroglobulin family protein n=1 Tax=Pseudorhodoferax sp. Leaf267 TaxID=1736316 RepID=UPI000701AC6A|nr:MG2 domain-containing protein [Pseudorhodoferax sp. Leaf267]KQP17650.1 alpha-2-macroglobulin [Pseudorhodoferax sp. Leaf267]